MLHKFFSIIIVSNLVLFHSVSFAANQCVAIQPAAVVKWVWHNRPLLSAADSKRFVSANFLANIRRDKQKAAKSGDICSICDGDIWTDSQEGSAHEPITITEKINDNALAAEVTISMMFFVDKNVPLEPRTTKVLLVKENKCWKIDDVINKSGSVKHILTNN